MGTEPIGEYLAATILSGQNVTDKIDLGGDRLCGLIMASALDGATTLKILASNEYDGTYTAIQKDEVGGGDYTMTFVADKPTPVLTLSITAPWRFIKIQSVSNQSADRTFYIAKRPIG